MDDRSPATTPDSDQVPVSEGSRSERRRRVHELLAAQRSQIDRFELEVSERLQQLAGEITRDLALHQSEHLATIQGDAAPELDALRQELVSAGQHLATRQADLDQLRAQLEQVRLDASRLDQELRLRETLLKEGQTQQEGQRVERAALREQLADAQAELTAARARAEELRRDLAAERERISSGEEETQVQRRRIARELKARRAEQQALYEEEKAELQSLAATRDKRLEAQLAAVQSEAAALRVQVTELSETLARHEADGQQHDRQVVQLEREATELRTLLEDARSTHQHDADLLSSAQQTGNVEHAELDKLRERCRALADQLAAAETKLAETPKEAETDQRKKSDLQRRFEMAVEEVREMKRANAELESKLSKVRSDGSRPAVPQVLGGGLDWEAQKQRLLASLEADDRDDDDAIAERTTIEGTIRITDQIIAEKDREIVELRQQLEAHGGGGSGAMRAAVAELLNSDELVRQEREKLQQMQAEWREKIGKAEIDVSVERAKIARDRAELEEKIRAYQNEQDLRSPDSEPPSPTGKPARGRWLARLGLKEIDEQS